MSGSLFAQRWRTHVAGRVGLGCWGLGGKGWGGQSDRVAREVLAEAWEAGYRHFDTAASYGFSERVLGDFLQGAGERPFVASKVYPGPKACRIRETICRSLERLRLTQIDLYYLHWPRGDAVEADVEALATCVEEGLVGALGVSNYSVDQLRRAHQIVPVSVYQGPYNLLWRVAEETVIPVCRELEVAFVGYGALAEGLLARMQVPGAFPLGDHRAKSLFFHADIRESVQAALADLREEKDQTPYPAASLMLRWALERPGVSVVLAGARRPGQARENKQAEQIPWEDVTAAKLDRISDLARGFSQGRAHYFGEHT